MLNPATDNKKKSASQSEYPSLVRSRWLASVSLTILLVTYCSLVFANAVPNYELLADAIYRAEGGTHTSHPYGILAKYKHTTPRQACINTISRCFKLWKDSHSPLDYLSYLSRSYCPVGAKNDPSNLNVNWLRNVRSIYKEGV